MVLSNRLVATTKPFPHVLPSLQENLTAETCLFCGYKNTPLPTPGEGPWSSTQDFRELLGQQAWLARAARGTLALCTELRLAQHSWTPGLQSTRMLSGLQSWPCSSNKKTESVGPWPVPTSCHVCKVFERKRQVILNDHQGISGRCSSPASLTTLQLCPQQYVCSQSYSDLVTVRFGNSPRHHWQ